MASDFGRRFEELVEQATDIESKATGQEGSARYVDDNELLNWKVKVRHLLITVCGKDSQHMEMFLKSEQAPHFYTNHAIFLRFKAVLLAAKEDYEGGYLMKIRDLIQADVFDNELEQAEELFNAGYLPAAAVVAGVVLETTLRQMCVDHGIGIGKLDKMNADLAKAGVYNRLVQKQMTALADIRNSAAHGDASAFTKDDVSNMIREVRRFITSRSP
jgi:hypothetical protein